MRKIAALAALALALATPSFADPAPQISADAVSQPAPLAGMSFLAGNWTIAGGRMPLFGARPEGSERVTPELDGKAYFIVDHSVLIGVEGQNLGTNDSVLLVYPDHDAIRAEYTNGQVGTAYNVEIVEAGKLVRLTSDKPGVFNQFTYTLQDADTIEVTRTFKRKADDDAYVPVVSEILKRIK